jgi:Tol biopolymer transport system component
VLYRDDTGNIVARNLKTGDSYKQTVDFNQEVIVEAACSTDGSQIGYLIQNFSESFRRISIHGSGAPPDFVQVPASVQGFAWSPDHTKLAVAKWDQTSHVSSISIVDVGSQQSTDITSGDKLVSGLTWSPDGSRLAYYQQDLASGTSTVELLDVSGGQPRQLIQNTDLQWLDPQWSPNGNGLIAIGLNATSGQMFRVDPDTGDTTQITQDTTIYRRGPQFSPDGSLIAFTGSIIPPSVSAMALLLHQFGIFVVNPDGSDERSVTVDPRTNPGANVDPFLNAYLLGWCAPGPWLDDLWVHQEATQ